jgi:hypothetical protein
MEEAVLPEGIMKKLTPEGAEAGQLPTITAGEPEAKAGVTPNRTAEAIVTTANLKVKIIILLKV